MIRSSRSRALISLFGSLVLFAAWQAPGFPAEKPEEKKEEEKDLPLEPERTIKFETDEATWLSLDVSPDGETLVLELLGDLYTLPIQGGEAKQLTEGMAFDSQPAYSPDGSWIAFLSDRDGTEDLWIMRSDGTDAKQLSEESKGAEFVSPAWSPEGDYVIVSKAGWGAGGYALQMFHVQGGSGISITEGRAEPGNNSSPQINAVGATVSPDGRYAYYARRTGGFMYNAQFPMWQLARRDMITGDEDVLTAANGSAVRPRLSPDGKSIVYATRHDTKTGFRIRDLESGEDKWLVYPVQRDDQESRFTRDLMPGYAFTPDGKFLVYTYGGRIHKLNLQSGEKDLIPFKARVSQKLGPKLDFPQRVETGPVRARLIQAPAQSPAGDRIAFSALTSLYVMRIPGGEPRRLTPEGARAFHPAWSPDGEWIAYVTWSSEGGHLYKIRADGSGAPKRLTRVAAFYSDPAWSPDGTRIVMLRAAAYDRVQRDVDFGAVQGMDLVWVPGGEGGDARLIIPSRGLGTPHFTKDPDRVYLYLSGGFGGRAPNGLVSMKWDGTDRRTHLKVTGPGYYFNDKPIPAEEIRISPDGRWALAHVRNQLYLTAVPHAGGDAPTVDVGGPSLPLQKITGVGADYFGWADDGRTITWAVGSTFYRRPFDTVTFENKDKEDEDGKKDEKADEDESSDEDDAHRFDEVFPVAVEMPRDVPKGLLVLRGGRVITMDGDKVIEDAEIVIEGNRIKSIRKGSSSSLPDGAVIRDIRGTTVVPGFVDTHAHWFEIRRGVMDVQNWSFLANLAYGVTAGLDVQTATNDMFAYQDLVDTGDILGPRAYSTGPGIFSTNDFKTLEEVKGVLTKYRDHYRTRNLKSYIVGNRRQRQLVVQASKELGMMPTTEGALDLKLDLTHLIDGFHGSEHSLPIVPLYKDVIQLFARSEMAYTPTLLVAYGGPWAENHFYTTEEVHDDKKLRRFVSHSDIDSKALRRPWFREDEYSYPAIAEYAGKILEAGGRVGIGSHGQLQGLGYHWEMWALASGGLKPMDVLRAATIKGAEIIGYSRDLGSLEKGKMADMVILEANPLDDIRNTNKIRFVVKNGELFNADTLDQLWPEEKKLEPLYWWDDEP